MSTPTPPPSVPYGPTDSEVADGTPVPAATLALSKSGVAGTAGKWALRLLIPIILRAIFRAIAK